MSLRRLSSALVLAAVCLAPRGASAGGGLDVQGWLSRPGVKLLAVEFYATWCKPCMAAVPKWKALHDKYRSAGLRLVVVATQDPGGACTNPGWSPDEVVCDDDGVIAKALGAGDSLPAAFLWSWQGHLLVRRGHVEEVDGAIRQWMREVPRLDVDVTEVVGTAGINKVALRDMVRTKLEDTAKLDIVASQQEREALVRLKANSLKAGYDEGLACELGKDLSANSLLNVQVTGAGARQRLGMVLLSAERGCMVASSVVEWDRAKPGVSVAEGVAGLMQKLRPDVEMPKGARGAIGSRGPTPRPGDSDIGGQQEEWQPEQSGNQVIVEFASDPPGAVVLLDGNLLCQDTAQGCSKAVDPGPHQVTMQKERYVKRTERVTLNNGTRVEWKLASDFAKLDVRTTPPGLPVSINKRNVGTSPLTGQELSPGTYEVLVSDRCYIDAGKRISLARDENKTVELAMKPREGAINVRAEDTRGNAIAAEVYVDGNRIGKTPGVFKLPICSRQLELRHDSYLSFTQDLSIEERKTSPIQARMESRGGGVAVSGGGGKYNAAILSPVRGRKAWVQVPSPAERGWCDVVQQAGLIVECDTNNPDQTTQFDLIVRCPNLPQNTFDLIQAFFGQTTERKYDWRSENKCGQYHEITIEIPKSWGLPGGGGVAVGGGGGGKYDPSLWASIRGRKAWVQVPSPQDRAWCDLISRAGLIVDCNTNNDDQETNFDLIVRCPNLPENTFDLLEGFFGVRTARKYNWRSENACGQYHEITIEIPKTWGHAPSGGGGGSSTSVAATGGKYDPSIWSAIRGRKAWVQVPSPEDRAWCDLISRAGLIVDCNTNNDDQETNFDLIVRCPNLPENTFDLLENFFDVHTARKYNWRSENACGQYHEITIEIPKTWGHAPSGGGGGGGGGGPLAAIRGRKVWLQVPTPAERWWCDKFTAAGVQVTCDTDNADQTNYDLIVRCPNLPQNTFDIIDAFVGRRDSHRYDWRSENKCGEYHEITVEIPR